MADSWDDIVVGGGGAGCACLARLIEETDGTVCPTEAGPEARDLRARGPAGLIRLVGPQDRDGRRRIGPRAGADAPEVGMPRVRMPGGSGSVTSMVRLRGRAADLDGRAVPGGRREDLRPDFEAVAARGGPRRPAQPRPLASRVGRAFGANDPKAPPTPEGKSAAVAHANLHDGRRRSAADAFLRPAHKTGGVTVLTRAEAERVILAGRRATGLALRSGRQLAARRGVVPSTGAIESPMVLMRSGVGPGAVPRAAGIGTAVKASGLAANLRDDPGGGLQHAGRGAGYGLWMAALPGRATAPVPGAAAGRGRFASPMVVGCAVFRAIPGKAPPGVQCRFIPVMPGWQGNPVTRCEGHVADARVGAPRRAGTGEALAEPIRARRGAACRPVGTTALGAVLQPDARLAESEGLRAADAGATPAVTSADSDAPATTMGWPAGGVIAAATGERIAA